MSSVVGKLHGAASVDNNVSISGKTDQTPRGCGGKVEDRRGLATADRGFAVMRCTVSVIRKDIALLMDSGCRAGGY